VSYISLQPLDFKAVGTGPVIANAALPGTREKSVAARGGTAANKLGGDDGSDRGTGRGRLFPPHPHIIDFPPKEGSFFRNGIKLFVALPLNQIVPFFHGGVFSLQTPNFDFPLCCHLVLGQKALFPIQKDGLAIRIVRLVEKGGGKKGREKGPIPAAAAVEAVGVLEVAHHVLFDALGTNLLVAGITLDLLAHYGRIVFGANGATGEFDGGNHDILGFTHLSMDWRG